IGDRPARRGAPRRAAQTDGANAAAPERQVFAVPSDPTVSLVLDFYENVYQRPSYAVDLFSDPLVRVDKNFQIVPGAATEWAVGDDGMTWTFQLDPTLVWSDGNPVTANDWVTTFRYAADPEHAWDFTWFWQGVIGNWDEAISGDVPLEELGVRLGDDEHTLLIVTQEPAPYLPAMLLYSLPLSAAALETHGPLYNTDPATAVSSGPFILTEWVFDQQIVYERNDSYRGSLDVAIERVIVKLATPTAHFTLYQDDEVDYMEGLAPAELQIAQEQFPDQIYSSVGDFRTFYLFFDVTQAPFDDIKVRQAFSHVIDRDAIAQAILGPVGSPAYSWLAPGFPASEQEGLKEIQAYDPELGRQLLAEAGYPGGDGFPAQELWLRNENPINQQVANAAAAMIAEQLGITIEVANRDQQLFMDSLTAKPTEILFGYVSYGMDFLDPTNMLGVWLAGGRHSWANDEFDEKVLAAASFLGPTEERLALFKEAERILVEDVPGVFIYHETPVQLIKPWVRGDALEPDESGNTSIHWPRYTTMSTVPGGLYITDEVPDR
ncbi:MAG: peptide ABC transporter substrate-binding protein, partial [Chloroflexota bacterium]|nr:peptide ABC transporter substrate-binding protein [Chloroflexota bacterium]